MKAIKLFFLITTILLCANCQQKQILKQSKLMVSSGNLYEAHLYSPELNDSVQIDIWLPDNYTPNTQHNVIYMHDGQNLFDANNTWNHQSWEMDSTVQQLINQNVIAQTIVVGVYSNGETRIGDLMPNKIYELITDTTTLKNLQYYTNGQIRGDDYLRFIVNTLKPFIDNQFPPISSKENTAIMGSSMGGIISLYAINEYPEVFGFAACLSTHINNPTEHGQLETAIEKYFIENNQLDSNNSIYLDNGTQGDDADYLPYFEPLVEFLQNRTFAKIESRIFVGDDHSERCWAKRIDVPFYFW